MSVAGLERSLDLLEAMAGWPEGIALGDLADRLGMPKSAVHRLLGTLAARGYVLQDQDTADYRLSLRLADLGFRLLDGLKLPDLGMPVLARLAERTGEYCRLSLVEGDGLVWVARAQGATQGLRYEPDMGTPVVLHATATGKAWLATLPEDQALAVVFRRGFVPPPQAGVGVIRTVDSLRADLDRVRARGYAEAVEEGEAGTVALAAVFRTGPAPGAPVAGTVSVAGPLLRMGPERRAALAAPLRDAAAELSALWPLRSRQKQSRVARTAEREATR